MMKITDNLLIEAKDYVYDLLDSKISENLLYHSKSHTIHVLKNAEIIGNHSDLSGDELNILRISTLFHDVGFVEIYDGHEEKSVLYAEQFLREKNVDEWIIKEVSLAIMATKVPQSPQTLISKVLCDADLMNMSFEEDYLKDIESLRKEWINCGKEYHTENEFLQVSLDFFKAHEFHTEYGKKVLKPKKEKTEEILKNRLFDK